MHYKLPSGGQRVSSQRPLEGSFSTPNSTRFDSFVSGSLCAYRESILRLPFPTSLNAAFICSEIRPLQPCLNVSLQSNTPLDASSLAYAVLFINAFFWIDPNTSLKDSISPAIADPSARTMSGIGAYSRSTQRDLRPTSENSDQWPDP